MTSTHDWLCAMLIKEYRIDPDKLALDAPLEALGVDSLGMAELLFYVEDEFGITLPPEPVQLPTLGDVVRFIDALILAQKGQGDSPSLGALPEFSASDAMLAPRQT